MGKASGEKLQTTITFDRFTDAQKIRLREHVAAAAPAMPCAELEQFLCDVFAQADVLTAYFRPTGVYLSEAAPAVTTVLPFDIALAAAKRAGAMPVLLPHERRLASLAALVYPCATFYAADPSLPCPVPRSNRNRVDELRALRRVLLDDALRDLRRSNTVMAHTLRAALGVYEADDCDPQQVARLVSSITLATSHIDQMWRRVSQSGN